MDRIPKSWQNNAVEKSADFTAALHGVYVITGTLTVTDPTPDQGHEYICFVRNGVATIGGTSYIAGQVIWRSYHSGAWSNTVEASLGTAQTWSAAQSFGAAVTIDTGSGALPATGTKLTLANADATTGSILSFNFGVATAFSWTAYSIGGTRASQSATTSGAAFFAFSCRGHDGTAVTGTRATYYMAADGLWSGSNNGTYHVWTGTPSGSVSSAEWMRLQSGTLSLTSTTASTSPTTGAFVVPGGAGIGKEIVLTASSTGAVYWGPTGTDGSVRCYGNGSGAVIFEKRASGSWTEIGRFG